MSGHLELRRADFRRRADFSPTSVYSHRHRDVRFISVHRFADEGVSPQEGESVDAWCELPTDVALIEAAITKRSKRPAGIWLRRDEASPQFLKVVAIVDVPGVTRAKFEEIIEIVADHPWAGDGFATVVPGWDLRPLPLK